MTADRALCLRSLSFLYHEPSDNLTVLLSHFQHTMSGGVRTVSGMFLTVAVGVSLRRHSTEAYSTLGKFRAGLCGGKVALCTQQTYVWVGLG